ncbi:MAG: 3-hydroxyacyl-CoA dehydrogenase [Planctomycetes bacterium]|nr:3-hydroxyacyl-CoA dehydrogenase [Planctomycetota bacterium]
MTAVGIIGAGTMGAGIAQVAVTGGWDAVLLDVDAEIVANARASIGKRLDRMVEKGRLDDAGRDAAMARLRPVTDAADLAGCDLVLEAIVEDLDVKAKVLRGVLAHLADDAIIATNTSSLSVTKLGDAIDVPHRTVGMHFFNPAPLLKLVEVIAGERTDPAVVDRVASIAEAWGKTVARAADVPGFIVNHVARPYYLEAFRILEDGYASASEIDDAMKRLGGFRMGPLELTDLIGQDVNTATTRSVWEQLDRPPLLHPSALQEQLVADGHLGRKTGRGVYDHGADGTVEALVVERHDPPSDPALVAAVEAFVTEATAERGDGRAHYVFARILVALIAQAAHAERRGVATSADIDTALKYGTNYPNGPFEWSRRIGTDACDALLAQLNSNVSDDRFK